MGGTFSADGVHNDRRTMSVSISKSIPLLSTSVSTLHTLQHKRPWASSQESDEFLGVESYKRKSTQPPSKTRESFEFWIPATSSVASGLRPTSPSFGATRLCSEISFAQPQPAGQEEATSRRQVYTEAASDIDLSLRIGIIHDVPALVSLLQNPR
jgi:hypothetical protein